MRIPKFPKTTWIFFAIGFIVGLGAMGLAFADQTLWTLDAMLMLCPASITFMGAANLSLGVSDYAILIFIFAVINGCLYGGVGATILGIVKGLGRRNRASA